MTEAWVQRLRSWREPRGILRFVDEQFGVKLDKWQEEALLIFESPRDADRRLSLQACVGPGKSAVLAWSGLWFIGCQGAKGEHPKGLVTAITSDNLKDNLWAEYAKWLAMSPYLSNTFTWTSTRLFANDHEKTWFIGTRSWPKTANADEMGKTFSGMHSQYVLGQVDEAGAVPSPVLRGAEQALSNCTFGKLQIAGNPISLEGMLYTVATQLRHQWRIVKITGDPDDPKAWVHSPRVGPGPKKWAAEQIETYGRDNPWVGAHILGNFPPASINALLSVEEVEAAMARRLRPDTYDWSQKRLGVDVARFGDDRSVIFPRQGMAAFKPVQMRNQRTTSIAARAIVAGDKWGAELTLVDDTGHWGHGVIDNMLTAGRQCLGILFSDKALDPRYFNRRAEMHFALAEWVKNGGMLPKLPELVGELTTPTYSFSQGKVLLEPKELVKKRLGRSPDLADALALTFAIPDMPGSLPGGLQIPGGGGGQPGHAKTDFDPWKG